MHITISDNKEHDAMRSDTVNVGIGIDLEYETEGKIDYTLKFHTLIISFDMKIYLKTTYLAFAANSRKVMTVQTIFYLCLI